MFIEKIESTHSRGAKLLILDIGFNSPPPPPRETSFYFFSRFDGDAKMRVLYVSLVVKYPT